MWNLCAYGTQIMRTADRKTDAKGSTKAIYIDGEFGGFAIHLVRR